MINYETGYLDDIDDIVSDIPGISELKGKNVLITGAGGLICSAVVDTLMFLNKYKHYMIHIYAAGRNQSKMEQRFAYWLNNSYFHIVKYEALLPIKTDVVFDYIIHGASNANPGAYTTQPVETMLTNLFGTNYLLEYLRKKGRGRFLYISSSEIYGKKKTEEAYLETDYSYLDILSLRACYPSSKRAAETLCASYMKEFEVDFVIVRPGHIYGPTLTETDNRASSQFPRDVKSGKNIVMKSTGMQLRSYCYVLDCSAAIITVLIKGKTGEAYNISNQNSIVTIRDMAEMFAKAAGKKVVFETAAIAEKESYNLMDNSSLNSNKLELLGWKGKYNLEQGVRRTLRSLI